MKGIRQTQTAIINRASARDGGYVSLRIDRIVFVAAYKQQSGQVLALAVIMMLVLGIATFILFNTGQLVTRKTKLTNAADAAAYSAAVEEARMMNFMAYTNRARIANQVAIAQAVSLVSWMNYARRTVENFDNVLRALSPIEAVPIAGEIYAAIKVAVATLRKFIKISDKVITGAAKAEIEVLDNVIGILSRSQDLVIGLLLKKSEGVVGQIELHSIASKVVYDNDHDARVTFVSSGVNAHPFHKWVKEFFFHYKLGPDHNRYKNTVMEARDGFTRNRHDNEVYGVFKKRGGTDLLKYDTWSAVDTLGFHLSYLLDSWDIPVGWGSAQTGKKRPYLKGEVHGHGWKSPYDRRRHRPYGHSRKTNKDTTHLATKNSTRFVRRYQGLRRYYDIAGADSKHLNKKNKDYCHMISSLAGPCITVQAVTRKKLIKTAQNIKGMAGGRMTLKDAEAGKEMTAMASAQVYFYRPYDLENFHRHDKYQKHSKNYIEYGSLFSPYWQARLVPTPKLARAALVAAQGVHLP
jgi:hypothetical protein